MTRLLTIALCSLAFVACAGDDTGHAPGAIEACTPDEDLLSARLPCVKDEQCPCGAACVLGRCEVPECRSDEACGEGGCDTFGRCRAPADTTIRAPVVPTPEGTLSVFPPNIVVSAQTLIREVSLMALGNGFDEVRLEAETGLLVRCDADGEFVEECVMALKEGEERKAWVRSRGDRPPAQTRDLRIHAGRHTEIVSYRALARATTTQPPLAGLYEGTASLLLHGVEGAEDYPGAPLVIPINVAVFPDGDGHRFAIGDPVGLLQPSGPWLGRLTQDTLTFPRQAWGEGTRAQFDIQLAEYATRPEISPRGDLRMFLDHRYDGLVSGRFGGPGQGPRSRWLVNVSRIGDLPEDIEVPAVQAPPPQPDTDAAFVPTAFESLIIGNPSAIIDVVCAPTISGELLQSAGLSDTLGAYSQDFRCADYPDLGLATPAARLADDAQPRTTEELLESCLADVADGRWVTDVVPMLSAHRDCIDAPRTVLVAAMGLGYVLTNNEADLAIAHRMLQQWLEVHTFIAHEVSARARVTGVMTASAIPSNRRVLVRLLEGWDIFMFPRFATLITQFMPLVMQNPDYRPRVGAYTGDSGEHGVGLPVYMLEALLGQVELAEVVLDEAWLVDEGESIADDIAVLFRRAVVLRALAATVVETARVNGPLPWLGRYEAADRALSRALNRLMERTAAMLGGLNPLGIEDVDLPLYFDADTMGADGRFSAISDFLVAGQNAYVPRKIAEADRDLEAARAAYVERRDRQIQDQVSQDLLDDELESVTRDYGEQILELCGRPDGIGPLEVLEGWQDFNARTCYQRDNAPADYCKLSDKLNVDVPPGGDMEETPWQSLLQQQDVQFQLCRERSMKSAPNEYPPGGDKLAFTYITHAFPTARYEALTQCPGRVEFPVPCGSSEYCARCPGGPAVAVQSDFMELEDHSVPVHVHMRHTCSGAAKFFGTCRERIEIRRDVGNRQLDKRHEVDNACRAELGYQGQMPTKALLLARAFAQRTGRESSPVYIPPPELSKCVRGEIGSAAIEIEEVAIGVQIALSQLQEHYTNYDYAIRGCALVDARNAQIEGVSSQHLKTMNKLKLVRQVAFGAARAAEATKDCAGGINPASIGQSVAVCAGAAVQAAGDTIEFTVGQEMEQAQREHDALINMIEAQTESRICYNDAEKELVGVNTQLLVIKQAMLELESATHTLNVTVDRAASLFDDGRAEIAALGQRRVRSIAHDMWLDERADRFASSMRAARRGLYLAVRAIEYERQRSSALRADVLAAQTPSDLTQVFASVEATALTRGINGRRPNQLSLVLSLRQHVLGLQAREGGSGLRGLDDIARFRMYLQDPRFARFGPVGEFLGQELPFDIAPLEALGRDSVPGIPIFAEADCGERLWSVNASIQGSEAMFRGQATSACSSRSCRIELRKSNTFFSQWCGAAPPEAPFQTASVRPARNLFLDGVPSLGDDSNASFSVARIGTRLDVPAEELQDVEYVDGASSELAARGLYGAYALFVPASSISRIDDAGDLSDGLVLDEVDDILIRIDYTSVAR